MSLWEKVKNIMSIPEEDEFDEELEETSEPAAPKKTETYDNDFSSKKKREPAARSSGRTLPLQYLCRTSEIFGSGCFGKARKV